MNSANLNRRLLIILLFLLSGVIVLPGIQNQKISKIIEREKNPQIGEKAFLFTKKDLRGEKITIKSLSTMLIFFNTTCEPCNESAYLWESFYHKYSSDELRIVGISADAVKSIKSFIQSNKLTFPVIADSQREIINKYKVKYFPLVVLLNRDGKILVYQSYGQNTEDTLTKVEDILKKHSKT